METTFEFFDLITSILYFNLTLLTLYYQVLQFSIFYISFPSIVPNMTEKYKEEISPDKMLKQAQKTKGYLLKKSSGIITSWNQRYFIILNGALAYYGD